MDGWMEGWRRWKGRWMEGMEGRMESWMAEQLEGWRRWRGG